MRPARPDSPRPVHAFRPLLAVVLAAALAAVAAGSAPCPRLVLADGDNAAAQAALLEDWVDKPQADPTPSYPEQSDLPRAYDLRDPDGDGDRSDSVVTPVKSQGSWGTCWAFANIAACETSILSRSGTTYAQTGLDLSELQLVQTLYHDGGVPQDVAGQAQAGEGYRNTTDDPNLGLMAGGDNRPTGSVIACGLGLGPEEGAVYKNTGVYADDTQNDTIYQVWVERSVADGPNAMDDADDNADQQTESAYEYLTQSQVDALADDPDVVSYSLFAYAANYEGEDGETVYTDWSVESQRETDDGPWWGSSAYALADFNRLPDTCVRDADGNWAGVDWDAVQAIKDELYADPDDEGDASRGVVIGYYAAGYFPGDASDPTPFVSTDWAQYVYEDDPQGGFMHDGTIVGWDDDYDASHFAAGFDEVDEAAHTPPGNGAWLVKCTWGSDTGDCIDSQLFPDCWGFWESEGHSGYIWVSYYDHSIADLCSYDFDMALGDTGRLVIDQYDYLPTTIGNIANASETPTYSANVFTATADMDLASLMCATWWQNTTVTYQVFLLDEASSSPSDGKLVYTGSQTYRYKGYHSHRMAQDERVALREGDRYSVVVSQLCEDDGLYYQGASESSKTELSDDADKWGYFVAKVNEGESWYGGVDKTSAGAAGTGKAGADASTVWVDWTEVVETSMASYGGRYVVDNASIKACGLRRD